MFLSALALGERWGWDATASEKAGPPKRGTATKGLPANSAEGSAGTNGAKQAGGFGASAGHTRPINCRMEFLAACRGQDLEPMGARSTTDEHSRFLGNHWSRPSR